jgi:hypothetical protein
LLACLPFDDWDDGICGFNDSLLGGYLVSNCSHIVEECFISCCCCCSYSVQNCDESHFLGNFMKHFLCQ